MLKGKRSCQEGGKEESQRVHFRQDMKSLIVPVIRLARIIELHCVPGTVQW